MPDRFRFIGTKTSTASESWYSTLLHELTHWSGAENRMARTFGERFGDDAYAMEEMVAELGAAFLCGDLEITAEPRPDHADYIGHWLRILS
jgi:antirestriction protein ArdC